jgi:DNA repair exonuclease SbcCD ATPase subunit
MAPADFQGMPEQSEGQSGPPAPQQKISFVKEAFHLQYNWIAMVSAGAFALVSGSFLPIILGGGLELMYLAIVPQHWRFQRLVRSWKFAEEQRAHQQKLSDMVAGLPAEMQSRYVHAEQVCGAIRNNFAQFSSTSQIFLQQIDDRLQGLLHGFARLLAAAAQQRQYLKSNEQEMASHRLRFRNNQPSTERDGIEHEIASLERNLSDDPPKVQEINKKRIQILTKRLEKFDKISENSKVVEAQCSAVEDVLMLVRDQSVTMRDPQEVTDRLDSLVKDVEQTEQTVQQVEAIFSGMSPDLDGLMSLDDSSNSSGPNRVRMSN